MGKVTVLDLDAQSIVKNIPVGDNPEGIAVARNHAFVANHGFGAGSTVSVINTTSNTVVKTIDVCEGPRTVLVDRQEDVWVFCTGRTMYDENFVETGKTNGGLRIIDSNTLEVVEAIALDGQFEAASFGQDAFYSDQLQSIFAVVNAAGILRINTETNIPTFIPVSAAAGPISAVAFQSDRLYVAHAPAYDSPGTVTIHNLTGAQTGSFAAGIIPTYILFRQHD